jgi:hypothetical protein
VARPGGSRGSTFMKPGSDGSDEVAGATPWALRPSARNAGAVRRGKSSRRRTGPLNGSQCVALSRARRGVRATNQSR